MTRLLPATICLLVLLALQSECVAQDFKTRQKEILKKVNATIAESSKQVPKNYISIVEAEIDSLELNDEELQKSLKETYLSWFKALGMNRKEDQKGARVSGLLDYKGETQMKLAMRYHVAEHVTVWKLHDPQLRYFVAPTDDPTASAYQRC